MKGVRQTSQARPDLIKWLPGYLAVWRWVAGLALRWCCSQPRSRQLLKVLSSPGSGWAGACSKYGQLDLLSGASYQQIWTIHINMWLCPFMHILAILVLLQKGKKGVSDWRWSFKEKNFGQGLTRKIFSFIFLSLLKVKTLRFRKQRQSQTGSSYFLHGSVCKG